MAQLATLLFIVIIRVLFLLERESGARTSRALWAPVFWLLIAGSRNVGEWVATFSSGSTMNIGADEAYMQGNPIDQVALGALIAFGIVVLYQRRRVVVPMLRQNTPIVIFCLYSLASMVWSEYPGVVFRRWDRGIGDFVMVMVVLTDPDPIAAIKRLLTRTGFILIPVSLLFIRYYPELGRSYSMDGTPMWSGVTGGKNSLGMICMIFGLGAGWRLLNAYRNRKAPDRKRRLFANALFVAMAAWLIHSANSATSLACAVFATAVMALASRVSLSRRPAVIHCIVIAVVAFALFALFFDASGGLVQSLGRNSTLTGRTDVWARALGIVKSPILGEGYESFWLGNRLDYMRMLDQDMNQAHDGYIEIYLNLGLVGVALIITILLKGYLRIVRLLPTDPTLYSFKLACSVISIVYNITESGFKMMSPIWIITLLAVMVVPKPRITSGLTRMMPLRAAPHTTTSDYGLKVSRYS